MCDWHVSHYAVNVVMAVILSLVDTVLLCLWPYFVDIGTGFHMFILFVDSSI